MLTTSTRETSIIVFIFLLSGSLNNTTKNRTKLPLNINADPEGQQYTYINQVEISTKQEEIFDQSKVESLETTNRTSYVNTNRTPVGCVPPPSAIVPPGKPGVQSFHHPAIVLGDGYHGSQLQPILMCFTCPCQVTAKLGLKAVQTKKNC